MAKEDYNIYGLIPLHPDKAKIRWLPVAASQTLVRGDPVILSSGQIAVAVSDSSAELVGAMAADSSSATAGTLVPVYADPAERFKIRASAATAETIGTAYDISGTTGAFECNVAGTSQALLCCWGTVAGDTAATDGRYLEVQIVKHAFADLSS
jgi:hypothetical protein